MLSKYVINKVQATIALLLIAVASQSSIIPSPPELAASAYLLMDANSGKIIVSHNADEKVPPASLTKMMTSYIVESELKSGRLSLSDEAKISEKAWGWGGSKMFLQVNSLVTIEDLLRGLIIQSGNDAAIALAEHIGGTEAIFAKAMNRYAEKLGMENTHFENASGWPAENHYSTARDLALLAQSIVTDHAEFYPIYSEREFTYNNITQSNRNSLLWRSPNVDGLKTGHTEEAGYCLVSSALQDGMRLIAVVTGTSSEAARQQESLKLLSYGFRYYETHVLYQKAESLNVSRVWAGEAENVELGLLEDALVTIPRGDEGDLKAHLEINPIIEAPVRTGDVLGTLTVTLGDDMVVERSLVALSDIPQAGFFSRLLDYISLFFFNLFN